MHSQPIKVLYIAGMGRSGSTLLARLLGEVEGFLNVGEAADTLLIQKPTAADIPCGCGEPIADCTFWGRILPAFAQDRMALGANLGRLYVLPWLLSPMKPKALHKALAEIQRLLQRFYSTVAARAGCEVIVDSSKRPAIAFLLNHVAEVELFVVHLVRDPRGIVASRSKQKAYLKKFSFPRTVFYWWMRNGVANLLSRRAKGYQCIRYEDLARDPEAILAQVVRAVTGHAPALDFMDGHTVRVQRQHILAGNPDKLNAGQIQIRESTWRLPRAIRVLVSLMTFPFLRRYRYTFNHTAPEGNTRVL